MLKKLFFFVIDSKKFKSLSVKSFFADLFYKHCIDHQLTNPKIVNGKACTLDMITIVIDASINTQRLLITPVINYTPRVMPQFGASR